MNNDNKFIDYLIQENKELKDKIKRLEMELDIEKSKNNYIPIPITQTKPSPIEITYIDGTKPFWLDGPTSINSYTY